MEKVIETQHDTEWIRDRHDEYRFWRYNRDKYIQWVKSRKLPEAKLDIWDRYIIKNRIPGETVVYDSQAIFWKTFGAKVVENSVPDVVAPFVEIFTPELDMSLQGSVSNLILYRPLSCKLTTSLVDYLTVPQHTRSGLTPCLTAWLAPSARIFFSIGQEFFAFNRLRITLLDWLDIELNRLSVQHNINLKMKSYSAKDFANGHVKMMLEKH
jgi:hypothetical protein